MGEIMGKILKNRREKTLFIAALVIALVTAILAGANASLGKDWVNKDYEDYRMEPDRYTVTEVPIKEFRTLNGKNFQPLTILDFYRVCLVDITFAGGQTMTFRVSRDANDSIGDKIKVAYEKHWDTDYDQVMKGSDIDADSIIAAARAKEVSDGLYARTFTLIAAASAVFAAAVFFICYKKKDAYEF